MTKAKDAVIITKGKKVVGHTTLKEVLQSSNILKDTKLVDETLKTIFADPDKVKIINEAPGVVKKAFEKVDKLIPKPEYLPRIEITYDKTDRKQPYKVMFYNCETRSVFQKMIVFTFQKALMVFRRNLIMEGAKNGTGE